MNKIHNKLLTIQTKLKAHKSQRNSFGNYNYRSLEDIFEAVKPLLEETKTTLTMRDELEVFNGIIFRKSIATLTDVESEEKVETYTFTQESLERKGMSPEQCSGSVSSYGSKYCLNKLFCIDDTKDADTDEAEKQGNKPQGREPVKPTPAPTKPVAQAPVAPKVEEAPKVETTEPPARRRVAVPTETVKPQAKPEVKTTTKQDDQW